MAGNGKAPVFGPGGGGGGGTQGFGGGAGYAGQVELSYSAPGAPDANILRFLLSVPSGGDTNGALVMTMDTDGDVAKAVVAYGTAASGSLTMKMYDGTDTLLATASALTGVNGGLYMASIELYQTGSDVTYAFRLLNVPASTSAQATGTAVTSALLGAVTGYHAAFNLAESAASGLAGSVVGHVVVQYAYEPLSDVHDAITGYAGELAGTRFLRVCAEQGIPAFLVGNASDTPAMGPQPDDKPMNVLQQTEDLDRGLMFEPPGAFGLAYRTFTSMTNQAPAVVADYSAGQLSPPFQPVEDDQLTRNIVTVTRSYIPVPRSSLASPVRGVGKYYPALAKIVAGIGSSYTAQQSTGPMSVQDPPNGVGRYAYPLTVNAQADGQLPKVAQRILAQGTVDDYRYPVITFDLTRPEVRPIFAAIMAMQQGGHLQVINPPSFLTADAIDQLAFGFTIDASAFQLTFAVNCVPESPFEV